MDPLYLEGQGGVVNIHPLPVFSILDHHLRRDASQDRVIGALLGHVVGGVVEVTDAFGVYHEQVYDAKTGAGEVRTRRRAAARRRRGFGVERPRAGGGRDARGNERTGAGVSREPVSAAAARRLTAFLPPPPRSSSAARCSTRCSSCTGR